MFSESAKRFKPWILSQTLDFGRPDKVEWPRWEAPSRESDDGREAARICGAAFQARATAGHHAAACSFVVYTPLVTGHTQLWLTPEQLPIEQFVS